MALVVLATLAFASSALAAPAPVNLGTAASYAVLAGSTVTNTGPTTVNGDLGLSPGTSVTGFPPGLVSGGVQNVANAAALQAKSDLDTAYNDAAGRTPATPVAASILGGLTLTPGVYSGGALDLTGTLTLDAQGNSGAVFIFQAASTLITASASQVKLVNGASPCNVFWTVGSSATLGTTTSFKGTIIAVASITLNTGATVDGRMLARTAAVTLDSNTINASGCGPLASTQTPAAATAASVSIGDGVPTASFSGGSTAGGFLGNPLLCPPASVDVANALCDHVGLNVNTFAGGSVSVTIGAFTNTADFDLYVCVNDATSDLTDGDNCMLGRAVAEATSAGESDTTCFAVPAGGGSYELRVVPFFVYPLSNYSGSATFSPSACDSTPLRQLAVRKVGRSSLVLRKVRTSSLVLHRRSLRTRTMAMAAETDVSTVAPISDASSVVTFSGDRTYQASTCGTPDSDPGNTICFGFNLAVTGSGSVTVAIAGFSGSSDFDLFVFLNNVQVAQSTNSNPNPDAVCFPVISGMTYKLRIAPVFIDTAPSTFASAATFSTSACPASPNTTGKATGRITGGGTVGTSDQHFSFNADADAGKPIKGKMRYESGNKGSICSIRSTGFTLPAAFHDDIRTAVLYGDATVAGVSGTVRFQIAAQDNGKKPSTNDIWKITVPQAQAAACTGGGNLLSGRGVQYRVS